MLLPHDDAGLEDLTRLSEWVPGSRSAIVNAPMPQSDNDLETGNRVQVEYRPPERGEGIVDTFRDPG